MSPVGTDGTTTTLILAGLATGRNGLTATYEGSATIKARSQTFEVTVRTANSKIKAKAAAPGGRKVRLKAIALRPARRRPARSSSANAGRRSDPSRPAPTARGH
jgi:hypothetical protein